MMKIGSHSGITKEERALALTSKSKEAREVELATVGS